MPSEPSPRRALFEALPGLALSTAMFAAATRAIMVARAGSDVPFPIIAGPSVLESAVRSLAAWLIAGLCLVFIALGIARRSHVEPAMGQLIATAIVYFRMMGSLMENVTSVVDVRPLVAVMWLYMPQSLAMACFLSHLAIAHRKSR